MRPAQRLALILLLLAAALTVIGHGRDISCVRALPFCSGTSFGAYDIAAAAMLVIAARAIRSLLR